MLDYLIIDNLHDLSLIYSQVGHYCVKCISCCTFKNVSLSRLPLTPYTMSYPGCKRQSFFDAIYIVL